MVKPVETGLRWLSGVAALGLVVLGCSLSTDPEAEFSVLGSLGQIPDTYIDSEGLSISMADIEAAARIAVPGVSRPEGSDDFVQRNAYYLPMTGPFRSELIDGEWVTRPEPDLVYVAFPQLFHDGFRAEFADEFGFVSDDVTSFISATDHGSRMFLVSRGVSPRTDLPELAPGIFTVGEGEDAVNNIEARTAIRTLGRPHRVAMRDGETAISFSTPQIQAWRDQTGLTLADDPLLSRIAVILDEYDVVSAVIRDLRVPVVTRGSWGWTQDDDGPLAVVVASFESEADAIANLTVFSTAFMANESSDSIERRGPDLVAVVRHNGARELVRTRFEAVES